MTRAARWGWIVGTLFLVGCSSPSVSPSATRPLVTPSRSPVALATVLDTPAPATSPAPTVILRPETAPVEFSIPPTIQHSWPGGVAISFRLPGETPVAILTSKAEDDQWIVALVPPPSGHYRVTLSGLSPGSAYRVAVGMRDAQGDFRAPSFRGETWGPLEVKVPAEHPEKVRLVILGDSGFGQDFTRELAEAAAEFDPDATLHTGDIVYRGNEEGTSLEAYRHKFYDALAPLLQVGPMYPVIGNHELDGPVLLDGDPFYYTAFPPLAELCCELVAPERREWYSVAWGDRQFLFLNSQAFFGHGDREGQAVWLEERLTDADFAASIPVMHVAPFSVGLHYSDGAALRGAWHPLFVEANVPLVLSGHDHNYQRLVVDGITYVVSGGGSATLYPRAHDLPETEVFLETSHFVVLDFGSTGMTGWAVAADGTILDEFHVP